MTPEHGTHGKHADHRAVPPRATHGADAPSPRPVRRDDPADLGATAVIGAPAGSRPTADPNASSGSTPTGPTPSAPASSPESYASFVPASKGSRPGRKRTDGREPKSESGRSGLGRKKGAIIGGVVAALLVVVYLAGVFTFMDRFMPNTTIMGKDVSLKSSAEVQGLLNDLAKNYTLDVSGQGFSLKLSSADLGMGINSESVTDAMHADMNPWAWPVELFGSHDESDKLATSNGKLDEAAHSAIDAFNQTAESPRNAGLDYDAGSSSFVVRTETAGTALDADRVIDVVNAAVSSLESSATLSEDALQKPTLLSTDERLTKAANDANALLKADFNLKLADAIVAQVNAGQIASWVRLGDDVTVGIDDTALTAWVQDIASESNTYQARRTFTRADGKEVTVSGGVYGWIVDKDKLKETVMSGVESAQTGDVAIPCEQEAGAYNGLHGRDWGNRYIDIDLGEQHARFYDDSGNLVWESDVVTGTPDGEHDTPEGVYVINNKESPSKLIGQMKPETGEPEYQTEVKTWMPFVGNYIGLHDADWQPAFGGSLYSSGNGSHGCVNLPVGKSTELYDLIKVGDVVVSHW